MNKLPLIVSTLALVVAIVAAVTAFRGEETDNMTLDRTAVETMIDTRIAANDSEAAPGQEIDLDTVGPLVREYLLANPKVIEDVFAALETQREMDQVVARSDALRQNSDKIYRSQYSPVVGNPTGDVTLVEFFDYNCGYCKRMLPALVDLIKADPNLRVVFKEWPVLTEGSSEAARIALAVSEVAPLQYLDFHINLMAQPGGAGGIDGERALQVVEDLGIDRALVEAAAKDARVDSALDETFQVAEALGLRGTPSYVIGETVIPGAVSFEELERTIAEARKSKCETC